MAEPARSTRAKASAYINALIIRSREQGVRRLPTVRELARGAEVSHWTISEIVKDLKRDGIVEASRSRGIRLYAAADIAQSPVAEPRKPAWQQVRGRLLQDLVNGSLGFGRPLPLRKELALRYGVSINTLRTALDELTAENVLVRHKRTFRVSSPRDAHSTRNDIVLFARGDHLSRIVDYDRRTAADFRSIEQECQARNIILRTASCYFVKRGSTEMTFAGRKSTSFAAETADRHTLGFMIWLFGITNVSEVFRDDLLRFLQPLGKPVAVFWDNREPKPLPGIGSKCRIRSFAFMRDFDIGMQAGRYLLALGHRRVCCLSASKEAPWTFERTRGLRTAFTAAGYADAVDVIAVEADERTSMESDETPWAHNAGKTIRKAIAAVVRNQGIPMHRDTVAILEREFVQGVRREVIRKQFGDHFRRLAQDRSITAWVGLNDEIAVEALVHLRSNGANVPGDISVMGFDDSMEAGFLGLTSYCFNGASAMHLMTEYIVRADSPLIRGDAGKPVIIEGFVHERASTGRARAGTGSSLKR
jgi:DNA-binding LacI/PurR family transcriptional regulator/DNA-binding transcriptional regulator YhcF (GntR family)